MKEILLALAGVKMKKVNEGLNKRHKEL